MTIISRDGVPYINGFDVTVIDVYTAYAREGLEPAEVADEFDIPVARVHEALAYYYDHVDQMRQLVNDKIVDETPDPDPEDDDLFFPEDKFRGLKEEEIENEREAAKQIKLTSDDDDELD